MWKTGRNEEQGMIFLYTVFFIQRSLSYIVIWTEEGKLKLREKELLGSLLQKRLLYTSDGLYVFCINMQIMIYI